MSALSLLLLLLSQATSVVSDGLFTTPWTAAYQAPPSMGFSRQEYQSGVPLPSPDPPPRLKEIKPQVNKWDLIKLKSFFTAKETINKMKRQSSEWEKITMKQLANN